MRTSALLPLVGAALSLCMSVSVASAAVVTNGSFESPDVVADTYYDVGETFDGWTIVGNTIHITDNATHGFQGVVSSDGNQFLDLTGNIGRGGGVLSDPIATVAGASYRVEFDVGAFYVDGYGSYGDATVDLYVDGVFAASFTNVLGLNAPGSDWVTMAWDFVADGSTTLDMRSSLLETSSELAVGLDHVRLTQLDGSVPEPATALLILTGLAGISALRRRQRAAEVR